MRRCSLDIACTILLLADLLDDKTSSNPCRRVHPLQSPLHILHEEKGLDRDFKRKHFLDINPFHTTTDVPVFYFDWRAMDSSNLALKAITADLLVTNMAC